MSPRSTFHVLRFTFLLLATVLATTACSKTKTAADANSEKVQAWKAQQLARAVKSYQEIVASYPDSPYAAQAKERIQAIGPISTPKPVPKKK